MDAETRTLSGDDLIASWILPTRIYPGDPEAYIVERSIPVWTLIAHWKGVQGDLGATAGDFCLPVEAVRAAVAYYALHRDLIDARLAANRTAVT